MSRDEKLILLQMETEAYAREFEKNPDFFSIRQVGSCLRLIHERLVRVETEIEKYNDGLKGQM